MSAMTHRLTRRRFLQSAAVAAATPFAARLRADAPKPPPSERLRVAMIGVTGQGGYDMGEITRGGAEIAVVCDVDENNIAQARKLHPSAEAVTDYRRIIDRKDIDAVAIGTPDHSHAIPTLLALQAGKHVFCEKPLTHNIAEARKVAQAAAKYKRVTQMGTQIHAQENYHRVVELIRAGAIGPVREAYLWVATRWAGARREARPAPVPPGLHYDLWLGPAPERPYSPAYLPAKWRGWWDFGGGTLADMGCHYYDLVQWSLELGPPARVSAEGPPVDEQAAPRWLIAHYEYPATANRPALKVHWHSSQQPEEYADLLAKEKWGNGVLFIGEKGMLLADYPKHKLLPADKFADYRRPAPSIPKSVGHYKEWVEACKTGGPTTCHFGYAGPLTETVLLGNVAYRAGTPIEWDAPQMRIPNAPPAERFLRREYRAPWGRVIESA
jgi:predicted dehydrogenase